MSQAEIMTFSSDHSTPLPDTKPRVGHYEGRFYTVSGGTHGGARHAVSEREVVIVDSTEAAEGVVALTLRGVDGQLPLWTAGSHVDLVLPDGRTGQYSLCGDPSHRGDYRLAVLRGDALDGVSRGVHALQPGDRVAIRGPRNQFGLVPAPSYLFIAGGIGITPILAMMRSATASGIPWRMYYLARGRERVAFVDEVESLGDVVLWLTEERGGRLDIPSVLDSAPVGAMIYCCGPQTLVDQVEAAGAAIVPGRVRTERFASDGDNHSSDDAIQVRCELSDTTFVVPPGVSILDAAKIHGVSTVSSCNRGICGTCETVVLEGTPEHRDSVLDDQDRAEGDTMMICVSRAVGSRLVLDL